MSRLLRAPTRILSFLRKELAEVLRQPRLIVGLILGPFLILLLVGIGFTDQPRQFRTIFVLPEGGELRDQIEEFATGISPQVIHVGNTAELEPALRRLERSEVDLVIDLPDRPIEELTRGRKAAFTFYSNEVDPFRASYVDFFSQVFIGEVNRRTIERAAEQGQQESVTVESTINQSNRSLTALESALRASNESEARRHQHALVEQLTTLRSLVGASMSLAGTLEGEGELGPERDSVELSEGLLSPGILNCLPGPTHRPRSAR